MAQAAWFFPYKPSRKPDDISSLWDLATAVVKNTPETLDARLFERCLEIFKVAVAKLTMGMFWLSPHQYIALDANNRKLFQANGISSEILTFPEYLQLLNRVKSKFGADFPQISRKAWDLARGGGGGEPEAIISRQHMGRLWERFHSRIPGFTDFESPGDELRKQELDFKRNALKRYEEEVGNSKLLEWVSAGAGNKALEELSKRIQAHLVTFHSWRSSVGSTDKHSAAVLRAYLQAAASPYSGPATVEPIIQATLAQGL
jgi:hypothetical protein